MYVSNLVRNTKSKIQVAMGRYNPQKFKRVPRMRVRRKSERRGATDSEVQRRRLGYGKNMYRGGGWWWDEPYYTAEGKNTTGRGRRYDRTGRFKENAATAGGKYFRLSSSSSLNEENSKAQSKGSKKRRDVNGDFERAYRRIPAMSGKPRLLDEREKISNKGSGTKQKSSARKMRSPRKKPSSGKGKSSAGSGKGKPTSKRKKKQSGKSKAKRS